MNLDNLDVIKQADHEDALSVIGSSAEQLKFQPTIKNLPVRRRKVNNIVLSGMGGSCLAGLIAKNWLNHDYNLSVPFEITRDYNVPAYVNKNTLVLCVSVSGNTEETISSLCDAIKKNAQIVIISTGGKLLELAKQYKLPYVEIVKISQPRYGVAMHLRTIASVLNKFKILDNRPFNELEKSYNCVRSFASSISVDTPTDHNPAKQLALFAAGKTVLVYSSSLFYPLAYKWKTSYNENAKNTVWCNEFPEFNHNEFIGWTSHPIEKPFAVVNLRSNLDSARINQRLELTEKLLSGHRPAAQNIVLNGNHYIQQVLCGAILGDISSIYLGLLNGVDPTPVELVEKFKKELG